VAECFWPGVRDEELHDLDRRVAGAACRLTDAGEPVSYLGRLHVTDDEVVLFLFEGPIGAVQRVTGRVGIQAERILRCHPDLTPSTRSEP
jgi:hypothetical protein